MTTPDILESVGFKKGKIGSGDKELGYVIEQNRLGSLIVGSLCIFGILGVIGTVTFFDVKLERRSFHRQLRREEHHAAGKLAQVEMELWAQYRDDIKESHEANGLLKGLDANYENFRHLLQGTITDAAKDADLNKDKAAHLADQVLHLIADMKAENLKHTKHLVEHLVKQGKKGVKLERHASQQVIQEIGQEEKRLREDEAEGNVEHYGSGDAANVYGNDTYQEDTLKGMLEGFWFTFKDYESEFKGKARENVKEDSPVYEQLKALQAKINSDEPPDEEEIGQALDGMDLAGAGVGLGSGRTLPAADVVEELLLIPKIPHKELTDLEQVWRKGQKDSVAVFEKLAEWHQQGLIPSGWLQAGVRKEEQDIAYREATPLGAPPQSTEGPGATT